jgi:mono/diheme cytochrome c family protein
MERRGGEWRYLVVDAEGRIEKEGAPQCAGCHASGVAEGLFGLPRPKTGSSGMAH